MILLHRSFDKSKYNEYLKSEDQLLLLKRGEKANTESEKKNC